MDSRWMVDCLPLHAISLVLTAHCQPHLFHIYNKKAINNGFGEVDLLARFSELMVRGFFPALDLAAFRIPLSRFSSYVVVFVDSIRQLTDLVTSISPPPWRPLTLRSPGKKPTRLQNS